MDGQFLPVETSRRRFLVLSGVALASAVAPAEAPGVVAAPARGADPEAVEWGVRSTMATFARMCNDGDASLVSSVLDPNAAALRRIVTEQVRTWARFKDQGRLRPLAYRVRGVRAAPADLWKADLDVLWQPFGTRGEELDRATYVFRGVGDAWLLSEATEAELGERRWLDTEHFRVRYWAWDEPLVPDLAASLERAYADDAAKSGYAGEDSVQATLYPTLMNPNLNNRFYAYYIATERNLLVRSPESYGFGVYDPDDPFGEFLEIVRHELGHHIVYEHLKAAGYAGRVLKVSLNEGFAEWQTTREASHRALIRYGFGDELIPDDLLDWADKRLANEQTQPPEQVSLAYALSARAVAYIVEERGGLERFWALVDAFMASRDVDRASGGVLGQGWAAFQAAYRDWVRGWAGVP
jgi:hypothetical protein